MAAAHCRRPATFPLAYKFMLDWGSGFKVRFFDFVAGAHGCRPLSQAGITPAGLQTRCNIRMGMLN